MKGALILIVLFVMTNVVAALVVLALGKGWLAIGEDSVMAGFIIGGTAVLVSLAFLLFTLKIMKRII